jgi:cytochrome c
MKALVMMMAVGVFAAGAVHAQSGAEIAKAKGCLTCHDVDKKKVGPAFRDVAAKYKGDKNAESMLVEKIRTGKGHPPTGASESELRAAVRYVLATK